MNGKRIPLLILAVWVSFALSACSGDDATSGVSATDYSQARHWLSIPVAVHEVDVFYLYPTAWQRGANEPYICNIDNPSMLSGSASAFGRSATAFETFANIYAPYYRQADAQFALTLPQPAHDALIGGIPTLDAVAAFDYYIKNLNNGRPFILAGHSQGSNVLNNILAGYLKDHPDVYNRMIAAYIIGYSLTQTFLDNNPHLKFAEGPDDTGVIISYNTQAADALSNPVVVGTPLVINPITWTRDETLVGKDDPAALGSYMPIPPTLSFQQVPQYADARIDLAKGVLICSTANEEIISYIDSHIGFPAGVYHSFDYPFYYFNIRANAQNRVNKYLGL